MVNFYYYYFLLFPWLWYSSFTDRDQLDFDVEVAIKVCRQAGYNKHALELAKKHGLHHWYLQIQLEDLKKFEEGLDYICSLDFVNAQSNIKKYGTILMKHLPQKTTEFLKLICTDFKSNKNNQTFISEEVSKNILYNVAISWNFKKIIDATLQYFTKKNIKENNRKRKLQHELILCIILGFGRQTRDCVSFQSRRFPAFVYS